MDISLTSFPSSAWEYPSEAPASYNKLKQSFNIAFRTGRSERELNQTLELIPVLLNSKSHRPNL